MLQKKLRDSRHIAQQSDFIILQDQCSEYLKILSADKDKAQVISGNFSTSVDDNQTQQIAKRITEFLKE